MKLLIFLHYYPNEIVILHLKNDKAEIFRDDIIYIKDKKDVTVELLPEGNGDLEINEYYYNIAKISINNTSKRHNKPYNQFFYQDDNYYSNDNILLPILKQAQGKDYSFNSWKFYV